jgi:hypothetical protein
MSDEKPYSFAESSQTFSPKNLKPYYGGLGFYCLFVYINSSLYLLSLSLSLLFKVSYRHWNCQAGIRSETGPHNGLIGARA